MDFAIAFAVTLFGACAAADFPVVTGPFGAIRTAGLAASVVSAGDCTTVFTVGCDGSPGFCGGWVDYTVTEFKTGYDLHIEATIDETLAVSTTDCEESAFTAVPTVTTVTLVESYCTLNGPYPSFTEKVCVDYRASGTHYDIQTFTSSDSASWSIVEIPVTAGASKLPTATAACAGVVTTVTVPYSSTTTYSTSSESTVSSSSTSSIPYSSTSSISYSSTTTYSTSSTSSVSSSPTPYGSSSSTTSIPSSSTSSVSTSSTSSVPVTPATGTTPSSYPIPYYPTIPVAYNTTTSCDESYLTKKWIG